jgi:DNA-binding MarR family transcriptional regulator
MKKPAPSDSLIGLLLERTVDLVRQEGRDLSLRQLAVLLVCDAAADPQTVRGLARHLEIAKPAVTRAVDRLKAAGLVRRTVDPSDRRSVLISCTPAGHGYCSRFTGAATPHKKVDKSKA